MHYENEEKFLLSYCGSYCHMCDWFTGKIRRTAQKALDMFELYGGFKRLLDGEVSSDDVRRGLEIVANSSICSGCKLQIQPDGEDRCDIRQCCSRRGFHNCSECDDFPCETLLNNPGVQKFGCIENLNRIKQIGIESWIDEQWRFFAEDKIE